MPTWKVPPVEPCDSATLDDIMAAPDTLIPPSPPARSCDTTPPTRTLPVVRQAHADALEPANVALDAMHAAVPTAG
jgi:hypothetical protein